MLSLESQKGILEAEMEGLAKALEQRGDRGLFQCFGRNLTQYMRVFIIKSACLHVL